MTILELWLSGLGQAEYESNEASLNTYSNFIALQIVPGGLGHCQIDIVPQPIGNTSEIS